MYQTWHMDYYHRPYQMHHVEELQTESVVADKGSEHNAFDNRIFDRVADEYGRRFATDAAPITSQAEGLEYSGRPASFLRKDSERRLADPTEGLDPFSPVGRFPFESTPPTPAPDEVGRVVDPIEARLLAP